MKLDKSKLEKMIKSGFRTVSDDELKKLVELELSKNEEDIDTDFIDLCFALMDVEYTNEKRVIFTKPVKNILIAAAIIVLMISAISVVASSNGKNPIKKHHVVDIEETTESEESAEDEENTFVLSNDNSGSGDSYGYGSEADDIEYVTVPDFSGMTEAAVLDDEDVKNSFEVEFEYGDNYSEDEECVVVGQNPAPGESLPKGGTIKLLIDIRNNSFAVPDFIGKNRSEVNSVDGASMFDIVLICVDGSTNYGEKIVSQTPEPGTMLPKGTTIYLVTEPAPVTEENATAAEE